MRERTPRISHPGLPDTGSLQMILKEHPQGFVTQATVASRVRREPLPGDTEHPISPGQTMKMPDEQAANIGAMPSPLGTSPASQRKQNAPALDPFRGTGSQGRLWTFWGGVRCGRPSALRRPDPSIWAGQAWPVMVASGTRAFWRGGAGSLRVGHRRATATMSAGAVNAW